MFQGGLIWGVSWVWYLIGTVGVTGTIALAILAPGVLAGAIPVLIRFFTGTRLGVGLLAAAVAFMAGDINRSRMDAQWWEAEKVRMVEAHKKRVAEIGKETAERVRRELVEQKAANTSIDKDVKDFTDEKPAVPHVVEPGSDPLLVGDDACRLRKLAGYSGCGPGAGPERAKRVQKARPRSAGARSNDRSHFQLPDIIRRGFGRSEQGKPGD